MNCLFLRLIFSGSESNFPIISDVGSYIHFVLFYNHYDNNWIYFSYGLHSLTLTFMSYGKDSQYGPLLLKHSY